MNIAAAAPRLWAYFPLDRMELREIMEAMRGALKAKTELAPHNLEVVITDDADIEGRNLTHLHCVGPTNILSFPLPAAPASDAPGGGWANAGGSLLLSVNTLRRESLLYGQNQAEHAIHLLAHGLAHLAGREHGPEMWALCELMENAGQSRLLRIRENS